MHGTARPRPTERPAATGVNAVVWIEPGRALVVRGRDGGEPAASEVRLPPQPAAAPPALAEVAHRIGRVDRVLVLGPDELRTALEREIVAIGHRPDVIREADVTGPLDEAALAERLTHLR